MAIGKHVLPRDAPRDARWSDDEPTSEWFAEEPTRDDPHTPVEQRFVLDIRDHPDDPAMRMVYADWLEQRDAHRKAEFVRAQLEPADERTAEQWFAIRQAAARLSPEWRAVVSRVPIDRCSVDFKFQCPKRWESLTSTDAPDVRFCGTCRRNVYFCTDLDQVRRLGRRGECVAFCASLNRESALEEYDGPIEMMMGEVA
ncbi:MAG TPA: TIGR02996 domain-containing protein [Kofleriaceae bacterium]|nr:TIGR02996 domain-containing protein [Kofleriaceae bacterium]